MVERYQIVGCSKCSQLPKPQTTCFFGKPQEDCPTNKAAQAGDLVGSANPPSKPKKQHQRQAKAQKRVPEPLINQE